MTDEALPPHSSRAEEVASRVRGRILRDAIAPGSRLGTKGELARRYGVSLGTVNGALRILESLKITESRPGIGGGVFVSCSVPRLQLATLVLSLQEGSDVSMLANVYSARTHLDVLVSRMAAESRTTEDIETLRAALDNLERHRGDVQSTRALHDQIALAAHSPVILAIYRTLVEIVDASVSGSTGPAEHGDVAAVEAHVHRHRELVEAIIAGNSESTTTLAEAHGRRIRQNIDPTGSASALDMTRLLASGVA